MPISNPIGGLDAWIYGRLQTVTGVRGAWRDVAPQPPPPVSGRDETDPLPELIWTWASLSDLTSEIGGPGSGWVSWRPSVRVIVRTEGHGTVDGNAIADAVDLALAGQSGSVVYNGVTYVVQSCRRTDGIAIATADSAGKLIRLTGGIYELFVSRES